MILEKLKRMEGFTHQEQAVARYILEHVEEIQQMSTEELARVSYTSKATVVRLCKKLDTAGYQELKLKLVSELVQNIRVNQLLNREPITETSTLQDILHTLPKLYDKAITDTELCMDKNVIKRICNRIRTSDRISTEMESAISWRSQPHLNLPPWGWSAPLTTVSMLIFCLRGKRRRPCRLSSPLPGQIRV